MAKASFLFNIIVTRLELSKHEIDEPQNLLVNVDFNKNQLKVTSSRINVDQFDVTKGINCQTDPAVLRDYLEANGLTIIVRYNGVVLGKGCVPFLESFINQIDYDMDYLTYAGTCNLFGHHSLVGSIDVMCLLTIKCESQDDFVGPCKDACGNIAKKDIMILMRNPDTDAIADKSYLTEPEEQENDIQLGLDLSRYRSINQRMSQSSEDSSGTEACNLLRAMATEYAQIIDSVLEKITELSSSTPDISCQDADDEDLQYINNSELTDCLMPASVTDADEADMKPIRFCPICCNSVSWMPKYAHCPRCWTKPVPLVEIDPEGLPTADQIIKSYVEEPEEAAMKKLSATTEEESAKEVCEPPEKEEHKTTRHRDRCQCKRHKMCSHCRVRKMCAELISSTDQISPSKTDEDDMSSINNRPQLRNVLMELNYLYRQRDHKVQKSRTRSQLGGGLNTKSL
ncbi:PREDICTED: uncharacterized protein LOC108609532 [Drosophila arizonae]|uniref:Uncharacterized protein LOC108609532 n=1 Tax=Drosophila arizonae TaxID=7263 RepID=A0ABM1NP60_DROAR|nr:PREDICTED: uncharacterized protein LOC108609532 [Drosophila arizonae]